MTADLNWNSSALWKRNTFVCIEVCCRAGAVLFVLVLLFVWDTIRASSCCVNMFPRPGSVNNSRLYDVLGTLIAVGLFYILTFVAHDVLQVWHVMQMRMKSSVLTRSLLSSITLTRTPTQETRYCICSTGYRVCVLNSFLVSSRTSPQRMLH